MESQLESSCNPGQLGVTPGGKVRIESANHPAARQPGRSNESIGALHSPSRHDGGADAFSGPVWDTQLSPITGKRSSGC